MSKKLQTNSFEKGMNKSLSKDRIPNNSYRDARNFRLSDDEEDSGGALVNIKGNVLDFSIPTSPVVFKVAPIPNTTPPPANITDTFTVVTTSSVISIPIYLNSGGFEDYFNQVVDEANNTSSALYAAGIKVIRTSPKTISVFSTTSFIVDVNSSGQSNYTIGTKFADAQSDLEVIGWCELRDSIVLFTTNNSTNKGGNGQIWFVKYNKVSNKYDIEIRYTNDDINFSKKYPIQAVARYENEDIQRVYWTDNFNKVRSLNIASTKTSMGVDKFLLNLNPSVTFSKPVLKNISSGGTLKAGVYQYAYRLSSSTGAQTKVSPASNLINVLVNAESGTEWTQIGNEYSGDNPGDATTKSVIFTINDIDTSYDTIELIYLYYGSAVGTPEIFIFESTEIPTTGSLTITHSGDEQESSLSETEYKSFGIPFDTAKTISYKDNRLVVANVKSSINDDLKFHARAYRFGNQNTDYDINGNPNPYNSANSFSVTGTAANIKSYVPGLNITTNDWGYEDPEDESVSSIVRDAINPYNKVDWNNQHLKFKWQSDGVTLGGEGPFVKYKFTTLDSVGGTLDGYATDPLNPTYVINDQAPIMESLKQTTVYDFNTNGELYESQLSPLNHKSPYIANTVKGYMPGEVYRFGIVLYDKAGNAGFVNWIGDIKFPERWEVLDSLNKRLTTPKKYTIGSTIYTHDIELNQLGLEFSVNLPSDIVNKISGYEIVRVKRNIKDRTKVSQGVAQITAQVESDDKMYLFPYKDGNDYFWNTEGAAITQSNPFQYADNTQISLYPNDSSQTLLFYAPEYQFYNNAGFSLEDRIRVEGKFYFSKREEKPTINLGVTRCLYSIESGDNIIHPSYTGSYGNPLDSNRMKDDGKTTIPIDFVREVDTGEAVSFIPGLSNGFVNATPPSTDLSNTNQPQVDGCKTLLIKIENGLKLFLPKKDDNPSANGFGIGKDPLLVTYERELQDQYGGDTQAARANNTYIKTQGFIKIEDDAPQSLTFKVFGGDIFHAEYDYTRTDKNAVVDDPTNYVSRDGFVAPLLSTFNTTLRKGRHLLNKAESDGSYPDVTITTQTHDTYEIESLYSREDDYVLFIGRQINVSLLDEFDNRIHASKAKINGETIDNWRQFETFLYKDVDGTHGPINNLINHNDNIYYFQDHACGYLLVNPRAQVTAGGAGSLQVGFGDVLHDFEYISTEIGCFHQWVPVSTNTNLFFIDIYHKQMYAIRGKQLLPISLQGGMNPWFFEKLNGNLLERDNPLLKRGITTTWDRRFNEVWVTFVNTVPIETNFKVSLTAHIFPSTGTYGKAVIFKTGSLLNSTLNIGDYFILQENGGDEEDTLYIIEDIDVQVDNTYIKINSYPVKYDYLNDVIDANGNIDNTSSFNKLKNLESNINIFHPYSLTTLTLSEETIIYNEAYDQFTGFVDYAPPIYINDGTNILSPNPNNATDLWRHNAGAYGSFYGNVYPSTLELVINDGKGVTKAFDNISYHSEIFSNTANPINIAQETFTDIRFYTDYQNSDWISLVPGTTGIRRVEREWQLPVSRNAVLKSFGTAPVDIDIFDPSNLDTTQQFKDRLRDKYMTIEFKYNNGANRRLLLNYLKTFYRFSAR